MQILIFGILVCLIASPSALAKSIYKCKTPSGILLSDKPCGDKAEQLSKKESSGRTSATPQQPGSSQSGTPRSTIDITVVDELSSASPDATIERIGPPAASYTHRGTEHWLYPNAVREQDGLRTCPEMLFEDGRRYQISWLPEAIMHKAVVAANQFRGWKPSGPVKQKSFTATDTGVVGEKKNTIVRKFGQPDIKRVFNGRELWEYEQVRLGKDNPQTLTIFLEFEGDTVATSAGN